MYEGEPRGKFILWNNKDITIDQKTLSGKTWFEHGIHFVQDLLSKDWKISSLDEFNEKFWLKVNYLQQCFQIVAAIPVQVRYYSKLHCKLQSPVNAVFQFLICSIYSKTVL